MMVIDMDRPAGLAATDTSRPAAGARGARQTVRVGLLGFGKTGRLAAEQVLKDAGCSLKWVIRRSTEDAGDYASRLLGSNLRHGQIVPAAMASEEEFWTAPERMVDVLIDFSDATAVEFYPAAADRGIRIVSAISHYSAGQMELIERVSRRIAVLHSANITVGVNFLMVAAKIMRDFAPHADIEIVEEHFREKKGVSGTAMRIAGLLGIDDQQIKSVRAGGIVGRHEVIFGMPNQTLRITHESVSRAAFGRGALLAAKWLVDRPPGLYSMESIVRESVARSLETA
jgi:4-hydroxy-tetrahydrodipicolinate reductase